MGRVLPLGWRDLAPEELEENLVAGNESISCSLLISIMIKLSLERKGRRC